MIYDTVSSVEILKKDPRRQIEEVNNDLILPNVYRICTTCKCMCVGMMPNIHIHLYLWPIYLIN